MKQRPILFSAPMVRALLAGTKTQTRRVLHEKFSFLMSGDKPGHPGLAACPYGQPGERLWVREGVRLVATWNPDGEYDRADAAYIADGALAPIDAWPWKNKALPSIHMPRGVSRITLEVTGVHVERLCDISEADAKAEGVEPVRYDPEGDCWTATEAARTTPHRVAYEYLWGEINGFDSWAKNPWVWAISFRRLETP